MSSLMSVKMLVLLAILNNTIVAMDGDNKTNAETTAKAAAQDHSMNVESSSESVGSRETCCDKVTACFGKLKDIIFSRSTAKSLTWRVIASCITGTITYIATKSVGTAFAVGSIDAGVKIPGYYVHEEVWKQIPPCTCKAYECDCCKKN